MYINVDQGHVISIEFLDANNVLLSEVFTWHITRREIPVPTTVFKPWPQQNAKKTEHQSILLSRNRRSWTSNEISQSINQSINQSISQLQINQSSQNDSAKSKVISHIKIKQSNHFVVTSRTVEMLHMLNATTNNPGINKGS